MDPSTRFRDEGQNVSVRGSHLCQKRKGGALGTLSWAEKLKFAPRPLARF